MHDAGLTLTSAYNPFNIYNPNLGKNTPLNKIILR